MLLQAQYYSLAYHEGMLDANCPSFTIKRSRIKPFELKKYKLLARKITAGDMMKIQNNQILPTTENTRGSVKKSYSLMRSSAHLYFRMTTG